MKSTLETWRRFRRLSSREQRIVIEAATLLITNWAGLRLFGFRRWRAVFMRLVPARSARGSEQHSVQTARAIARLEQSAANHLFFRANCLEQSLALCGLLRRRGIGAELRMGARKDAGRFEAHAWVECGGVVLNPAGENHLDFVPFDAPANAMETLAP